MHKIYAPVAVFAYNRVDKLMNCIDSLEKCPEAAFSNLYIFCDGPKSDNDRQKVTRVREFVRKYSNKNKFKSVSFRLHDKNRGLATSIIGGVTEVVNEYGRIIVVEDDLVVLPSFLRFLNEGLDYYRDDNKCGSISAFAYPMKCLSGYDGDVFATQKAECWGWATWADRWNNAEWKNVDFQRYFKNLGLRIRFERLEAGIERLMYLQYKGRIDSWAVRWIYYLYNKDQLTVYPTMSRVINKGFDGSGTHFTVIRGNNYNSNMQTSDSNEVIRWEKCELNERLAAEYARFPRTFLPIYILETVGYLIKGLFA